MDRPPAARARAAGHDVPHRAQLERSFGRSLGHVTAYTGMRDLLDPLGADACATQSSVAFASSAPAPSVVAHEVAHVLQHERGGPGAGAPLVAPRSSMAEREADGIAARVASAGAGAPLPSPTASAAGSVHMQPHDDAPFTTITADQEGLLRAWIAQESPATPRFDPSTTRFDPLPAAPTMAFGAPTPAMTSDDMAQLQRFMESSADAAPPTPAPTTPPRSDTIGGPPTLAHLPMQTELPGLPSFAPPSPRLQLGDDFGFPSTTPHGHPCPNCHDSYYERRPQPPPYDPHPDWVSSRDASHEQALGREAHTAQETEENVEFQALMAEGAAIDAAAQRGAVPEDLRTDWQQATMNAEVLRTSVPALGPDAAALAVGTTPPTIDETLAETTRGAIDAFYWALIDALRVQEARAQAEERSTRAIHDQWRRPPTPCPNCHSPVAEQWEPPILRAPTPQSPAVVQRASRLGQAMTFPEWRAALLDFDSTVHGPLEGLLADVLPADSREASQLRLASQLQGRIHELRRDHPNIIRVPAVFYPKDDVRQVPRSDGSSEAQAQGYSWYLFLYTDDNGDIVLKDVTSDRVFTNHYGGSVQRAMESLANSRSVTLWNSPVDQNLVDYPDGVMADLFDQLNTSIRFPEGMLYYELPGGRHRQLETTEPWSMSDWLAAVGIALVALGLVLATAGAGTPAAVAMLAAGVTGALGAEAGLEELEQQGIATQDDRNRAYLMIAVDLVAAFSLGLGEIAEVGEGASAIGRLAYRLYAPVRALSAGLNVAQAYVVSEQFYEQFRAIEAMPDSPAKTAARRRLVLVGIATAAFTIASIRGDVQELGRLASARPVLTFAADGALVFAPGESVAASEAIAGAGATTGGGLRWRAHIEPTEVTDGLGGSAVVEFERGPDGLVRRIQVRHGPGASEADVALHEDVARLLSRYGGLEGRIRQAWRDMLAQFGSRRPPVELEIEVAKLEEAARRRIATIADRGTSSTVRASAEHELEVIESNLARAQQRAAAAAAHPAAGPASEGQIWMLDAPDGYPGRPADMGYYLDSEGHWQLRALPGRATPVQVRVEYDEAGNLLEVSNRAQVARARVIGRPLSEVRDRLEEMGYSVGVDDVISRRIAQRGYMIGLRADRITGVISEAVEETQAEIQQRIEAGLTRGQRAAVAGMRARAASADQTVVLLEGVYDLRTTWAEVIAANQGRAHWIRELVRRGVAETEATRIVDGLAARRTTLQAVRGTTPLRSFDYTTHFAESGGSVPVGGHVHHADPLYLAGTHELLSGLDDATHRAVHEFFDSVRLPGGSALPRQRLQPSSLFNAVPADGWRRGAATIHPRGSVTAGRIDYTTL